MQPPNLPRHLRLLRSSVFLALVLAAGLLAGATGCSALTHGLRHGDHGPDPAVTCTETVAAPVTDTVGAILFSAIGTEQILQARREKASWQEIARGEKKALASSVAVLAYAALATYGYITIGRCRPVRKL